MVVFYVSMPQVSMWFAWTCLKAKPSTMDENQPAINWPPSHCVSKDRLTEFLWCFHRRIQVAATEPARPKPGVHHHSLDGKTAGLGWAWPCCRSSSAATWGIQTVDKQNRDFNSQENMYSYIYICIMYYVFCIMYYVLNKDWVSQTEMSQVPLGCFDHLCFQGVQTTGHLKLLCNNIGPPRGFHLSQYLAVDAGIQSFPYKQVSCIKMSISRNLVLYDTDHWWS